jgi:pentatricopeptide repeat protein
MESELNKKIAEYALKLEQLTGPEDKRVKKRVLQALGKLKKQLAGLGSSTDITDDVEIEGSLEDEENSIQKKQKITTAPAVPEITLTRKQLKAKLKLLNKELAEYAQKKQLKLAIKRYNWGVKKGMEPDKHTFANLMNAYVRCGDLDGALSQFTTMQKMSIEGNIVIYTTLLKGYCDRGDLIGASNLLFLEIPKNNLLPGIRTVNTFIRGCTKTGIYIHIHIYKYIYIYIYIYI